ncbi:MAG: DEAD/DEAH box helicase domain protein [Microgenomates group bacterium GW2011_GWA2_46_7]|nr:MAG: DEAD/DEAH box helicase domain protein [Microgenomates group bacterium GW2011_GWA2_46_7]
MSQKRSWFGGSKPNYRSVGRGSQGGRKIKYMSVSPAMLVKQASTVESREYTSKHTFAEFVMDEQIKKNVIHKGYDKPTPIQDQVIPEILAGRDVIGLASTGTGKTAAFLLPLIDKVMKDPRQKVLVVTPTRELAVQIMEEGKSYAFGTRAFFTICIGGVDIGRQVRELRRNPQFVVGTPGRLKDLSERRELKLFDYHTIVLDEVDRMLDMGFVNEMRDLIRQLPRERHSLFFSATMSEKARAIAREFLHDPVTIQVESQGASENVNQDVVKLNGRSKVEVLHEMLIRPEFEKVLLFGRTKHGMERLTRELEARGFKATSIHGNKSQSQRQRALSAFKNNQVQILLATDVAARGLDIDSVSHVINYELPETYEDYIHRIGRTGRADKTGYALTFID